MTEAVLSLDGTAPAQLAQNPLVSLTFQRSAHRKEKYLEAEPKALGVAQIGLSVYQIICVSVFLAKDLSNVTGDVFLFIASLLVVAAGSVAIAAQKLNLKMLQACLGMQIVACVASIFNAIASLTAWDFISSPCWSFHSYNFTQLFGPTCHEIEIAQSHFLTEGVVIHIALAAISITLAVYSCKVVNCCVPAPKVPVITVQAPPPVQQ
ncbi:uncharacterized protein LOC142897856 [Nelusetta ayraudi]|uniref:uncharacterized protein LOC142897856 n=1 Tax=Nelusetta ayraudi TaxID=303726 RepID=UPI003F703BA7